MKKILLVFLALSVSTSVMLTVWQAYRFQQLEAQVRAMEEEQKVWFEENKRKIIGIEYLSSPQRLDQIARDHLDVEKLNPDRIIRIVTPEGQEDIDG